MDIKIRCPHCQTKLVVGDELVGQNVLCEDCNTQFVVEAPAATAAPAASTSGERPRAKARDDREPEERPRSRRREDDAEERPRSRRRDDDEEKRRPSRDDFDDEDDRPIRRPPKRSSSHLAPLVFGSLLVVMTLGMGVGMYFVFGFGTSTTRNNFAGPNNFVPPNNNVPAGGRFRVSDARWVGGNTFTVTVETTSGRPDPIPVRIAYQSRDGSSGQLAFSLANGNRQSVTVPKLGPFRSPTTIWVEQNGMGGMAGGALSNTITLN